MASLGLPFQGEIRYYVETGYGVFAGADTVGLPISIRVLDARLGLGDKHKAIRGFDSPNVGELLEQCEDYTFHLEYIPQCGDTLLDDANTRDATCALESLTFYLITNDCLGSDQSIYTISGAKCKTTRISASINNEYVVAMDFSVKSVTTSSTPTGSAPTDLAGEICAFNIAGSIQKDAADIAYITNSIDITIDNGIKDYYDHDSLTKQYAIESEMNVSGTVDISLDEGGAMHLAEVVAQTDFDIVVSLGGVGCPTITLSDCQWKSSEIDVNISGDIMKESAPFTALTFEIGTTAPV